jgi:sortase A
MWRFCKSSNRKNTPEPERVSLEREVLIWSERALLVSGLALAGFYGAARVESGLASRAALEHFAAVETPAKPAGDGDAQKVDRDKRIEASEQMESPNADFRLWSARRMKAYKLNVQERPGVALAVLRIPKIGLEAPLFDGTDNLTLNHGVGRIAGTARPGERGNIAVAGHRDGFFRGLKDLSMGDSIELKTLEGTASYVVDQIQIVLPRQVEVLRPTAVPSLTLVTCYPFYFLGSAPQRYIVTASLSPEKKGDSEGLNLSPSTIASHFTRRKQMNLFNKASFLGKGAGAFVLGILALGTAAAQDSTVTTVAHGQSSFDTQVKNAEVIYAEGNDLVLKLENGRVEHLVVPDSDKFTIDGKKLSVQELVPGTKLTQTITTTTTPRYVNTVRTIEGKVWHVNAPQSVILTLPDNTNQIFNIPSHAKFTVNGEEKTAFDLKKGMKIKATIVSDEEHTIIESNKVASGRAPRIIATPREVGVLLFAMPEPPVMLADAGKPAETLPATGSSLPLVGLLGALTIALSLGLRAVRQTRGI